MTEIETILAQNSVQDLRKLLRKRACLNNCNVCFVYLFHLLQTGGVIVTSIYASFEENKLLLWLGIGLNAAASLVSIYEKANLTFSEKMVEDIKKIKDLKYVDESTVVDMNNPETNKP